MVRDYHGYFQGYNVQVASPREQIIVAAEVTRAATDVGALQPMLEAVNRTCSPWAGSQCGYRWRMPATTPMRTCGASVRTVPSW